MPRDLIHFRLDGDQYILIDHLASHSHSHWEHVHPEEMRRILSDAVARDTELAWHLSLHRRLLQNNPHVQEGGAYLCRTIGAHEEAIIADVVEHFSLFRVIRSFHANVFDSYAGEIELADLIPSDLRPEEKDWIEVVIVNQEDQPQSGIEYEIQLSDGSTRRGKTNEHGVLYYDDLQSGDCKITLLEIDAAAWELV